MQLIIDKVYRNIKWISGETDQKAIQNANFHATDGHMSQCNIAILNRSNDDKMSKLIEIVGTFK